MDTRTPPAPEPGGTTTGSRGPLRGRRPDPLQTTVWSLVALVGAACWSVLALARGEEISVLWILFAALASYATAPIGSGGGPRVV